MAKKSIITLLLLIVCWTNSMSQITKTNTLYKIILAQDSLLFSVGFNTCDIKQFENLLSDDFKFYHDKDGTSDKVKFLRDLKNGLCKDPERKQVKRILIEESTQIFPLYDNGILYGAIQNGSHLFYESPESEPGIAKFSHVWYIKNDSWKLSTSLSFDHQPYSDYQQQQEHTPTFDDDTAIKKWIRENNIPILGIGIIESGILQPVKVFGELSKGVAAPYNTIFNVASLTKPVTAVVALKLVSSGSLGLDEPLYKYWTDPDTASDPRNKKLTTRLILSHQTGFPNWRWMKEDKKLSFEFDPGTKYQYSGEGMEYLRKALEKKYKKSLQQLADELIFKPAKMTDTRYILDKVTDTLRVAAGYDKDGNRYETIKNNTPNGADDLLTTIEDYGNFLVHLINGNGLTKEVYEEMISKQVPSTMGKYFGLGIELYDFGNGETAWSHGGSDSGVRTLFIILPKSKKGLLIFTNSDTGTNVYEKLIEHYLGDNGKKIIAIEMD